MVPNDDQERLFARAFDQGDREALDRLLADQRDYLRAALSHLCTDLSEAKMERLTAAVARRLAALRGAAAPRDERQLRACLVNAATRVVAAARRRQAAKAAGEGRIGYEELLAYHKGQAPDWLRARIEKELPADARLEAHLKSVRELDLARMDARRDGAELAEFDVAKQATPMCFDVARSGGEVLQEARSPEWKEHLTTCAYCRRMALWVLADEQRKAAKLPAEERLLREWLLEANYREGLERVTGELLEADEGASGESLRPYVYALARRYTRSLPASQPADFDDIVQEVMLHLLHEVRTSLPLRQRDLHLAGVTRRVIRDRLLRERRGPQFTEPGEAALEPVEAAAQGARIDLDAALATLSPEDRSLVVMYGLEGRTMREAAAAQGISTATAHNRYHRALALLGQALGASRSGQ